MYSVQILESNDEDGNVHKLDPTVTSRIHPNCLSLSLHSHGFIHTVSSFQAHSSISASLVF